LKLAANSEIEERCRKYLHDLKKRSARTRVGVLSARAGASRRGSIVRPSGKNTSDILFLAELRLIEQQRIFDHFNRSPIMKTERLLGSKPLFLVFMLWIAVPSTAQVLFQKTFGGFNGDQGSSVDLTNDGGYVLAGNSFSFVTGLNDVFVIKTDQFGNIDWAKNYGMSGVDIANSIKQLSSGGFIIAGNAGFGGFNGLMIKIDQNGDLLWAVKAPYSIYRLYDVIETFDGGYVAVGYGVGVSSNFDIYVLRLDASGNTMWCNSYGSIYEDRGYGVTQTADSGFAIAGQTNGLGAGLQDVYVLKVDQNGQLVWTRTYGGSGFDGGYGIQSTADSGLVVCGYTRSFAVGYAAAYLIRTDAYGDTLWTRAYEIGESRANSVAELDDGGFILTGKCSNSNGYLVKVDGNGNQLWSRRYGGNDVELFEGKQALDGGFVMCGTTEGFFGAGYDDYYVIKTDSIGGVFDCYEQSDSSTVSYTSTVVDSGGVLIDTSFLIDVTPSENQPPTITTDVCNNGLSVRPIPGSKTMRLFPNPFSRQTTVSIENGSGSEHTLVITTLIGEHLKTVKLSQAENTIPIDGMAPGMYLFHLFAEDQKVEVIKAIVQ